MRGRREDELAAVQAICPANIIVLREKSAWVTNAVCMRIMRRLRLVLAPLLREYQPILIMDTASPHIARDQRLIPPNVRQIVDISRHTPMAQ